MCNRSRYYYELMTKVTMIIIIIIMKMKMIMLMIIIVMIGIRICKKCGRAKSCSYKAVGPAGPK